MMWRACGVEGRWCGGQVVWRVGDVEGRWCGR